MTTPTLVLAATRSGEGKTTLALGLMALLRRRGHSVQGFKVGPDYLDTTHQAVATGRPGRNLDLWMMGDSGVRTSFQKARASIAVVEGVMGLFDGHRDGVTPSSTADVAKRLGAPVILILDAAHSHTSLAAVALGFAKFDPEVHVAGVILNRWRAHRSRISVEKAFSAIGIPVLGWVPPETAFEIPSRHLGILGAGELGDAAAQKIAAVADALESCLDLASLLKVAQRASLPEAEEAAQALSPTPFSARPRIGVAQDEAFFFYYPENLELLESAGADIVPVSPLHDVALPPDLHGLYLGGGYPELHVQRLSENLSFLNSLRAASHSGMPLYAECGGLMYLTRSLRDGDGKIWPLAGVVPGVARMHPRLQGMGYRATVAPSRFWGELVPPSLRGHEFHYSSIDFDEGVTRAHLLESGGEGFASQNITASYMHLHFSGCPEIPLRFVKAAASFQASHIPSRAEAIADALPKEFP